MKTHFDQVDLETLVVIGDRYSTDVLFGNLNGTSFGYILIWTTVS